MKEADRSLKMHRAKHPHRTLDVHFLSLSVQVTSTRMGEGRG